jgi:metal-responsive CopG/Arc/MetJ family transcriptional regulator
MSRASINMPAGLLSAIDAVAAQGTGGNRSAAAVKLIELG